MKIKDKQIMGANRMVQKTNVYVEVKVSNGIGRCCLNEIYPRIAEGSVIKGNLFGDCLQFKWHGHDAVLWLGQNCELTRRRKFVNK